MTYLKYILILIGFIFTACESEMDSYAYREVQLNSLLEGDDALGLDGLDDEGATDDYQEGIETNIGTKILESYHPDSGYVFRFGRRINSVEKSITYTHEENISIAEIIRTVSGDFISKIIDTTANDTFIFEKDFQTEFQRRVRFINESISENQRRWKIDALTLGIGGTGTKMNIHKLEYYTFDNNESWVSIFQLQDGLDEFIPRDSLPMFDAWNDIKVELTVSNQGPEFDYESGERVSFHYGKSRWHKARRKMYDGGQIGDQTANDNIFTKIWTVHGPGLGFDRRVFRGFFSVIDYQSLFNSEEDLHTTVWTLPYIVNR
ncbi:MAG: hypothetical protein CMG69_05340 [Candidatus Marinimicrobia bacterium]|nr:hypothetical protein [Candidatus Neomarinimicrobiota bacterium]|tara:strand:+ start:12743 stop:13699 length:957 start_codon:yes stop_codon:yes gene_type:complete